MDTDAQFPERDSSSADQRPEEESRSFASRWREPVLLAAVCLVVLIVVNAFLVQPFVIPSGSMENTLRVGDRVLVNKLAYRFGDVPERGDVVVFDGRGSFVRQRGSGDPTATGLLLDAAALIGMARPGETDYVKRVVGVGGDRVTCCDDRGRLTVNGSPVTETYLHPGDTPSRVTFDIEVPEGRLWVMGDHRVDSRDSRDHLGEPGGGTVPVDKVIGRVDWIVWPLGRAETLDRGSGFDGVPAPDGVHG